MDFARRQLESYGWKEGKGLGRHEDGISTPIKTMVQQDRSGFGAESNSKGNWWENLYNKASSSIKVESTNNGAVQMKSTECDKSSVPQMNAKLNLKYGSFIQSDSSANETTNNHNDIKNKLEVSEIQLSDADLFATCEKRTAHKGARHNLNLNGKLDRLDRQEKYLLKKMRKISLSDGTDSSTIISKKLKKLKKHQHIHHSHHSNQHNNQHHHHCKSNSASSNSQYRVALSTTANSNNSSSCTTSPDGHKSGNRKHNNRKKRKSVTFSAETCVKYFTVDPVPTTADEVPAEAAAELNNANGDSVAAQTDEGIESDVGDENANSIIGQTNTGTKDWESNSGFALLLPSDLSRAERKRLKKLARKSSKSSVIVMDAPVGNDNNASSSSSSSPDKGDNSNSYTLVDVKKRKHLTTVDDELLFTIGRLAEHSDRKISKKFRKTCKHNCKNVKIGVDAIVDSMSTIHVSKSE